VDHRLDGLKAEYDAAEILDDLQDVGRRSREILIDAANLVFHDWMVQPGGEVPSPNDAKARIDGFLDQAAAGKAREDLRRVLRASHTLNNTVTHSNHTTRAETFAAAQATVLMVRGSVS
jgi:hypothetical protein